MTTATPTNLDKMTTQQAKDVLDKVIKQIAEQDGEILVSYEDIETIAYSLENNLQIRDYLMGITEDGLSVESVANILRIIVALLNQRELPAYPAETVLASYMYRLGDDEAFAMLANGLARGYSLAGLLARVFSAGWSADMFAEMTADLHHKVLKELEDTAQDLVNENLR